MKGRDLGDCDNERHVEEKRRSEKNRQEERRNDKYILRNSLATIIRVEQKRLEGIVGRNFITVLVEINTFSPRISVGKIDREVPAVCSRSTSIFRGPERRYFRVSHPPIRFSLQLSLTTSISHSLFLFHRYCLFFPLAYDAHPNSPLRVAWEVSVVRVISRTLCMTRPSSTRIWRPRSFHVSQKQQLGQTRVILLRGSVHPVKSSGTNEGSAVIRETFGRIETSVSKGREFVRGIVR